eukprot:2789861-Ditylum_brightwellii.AAC.1
MIEESGRFKNMTGFANVWVKNNIPIGSGLTFCERIWLVDMLKHNVGDQRLVAPVENSEEMIDMRLEVNNGLLVIKCSYPLEEDLSDLPRVWQMTTPSTQ